MSEDMDHALPASVPDAQQESSKRPTSTAAASRGGFAWLIALLALIVAGVALWRAIEIERGQNAAQDAARVELGARIDALTRNLEQRKRDFDSLRTRVADVDGVNRSVREELLGLGERSRHLEDAVANLAELRSSGRDALALNEAEFLLQQAKERLGLFHDAQAAIVAYQLADSALASAEDPLFASVRQTISAELQALEASKPTHTRAALATLGRARGALANLPTHRAQASAPSAESRWQAFFSQFVHISHRDDTDTPASRDIGLSRSLAAIDLRAAEAALFARDADAYKAALDRARSGIATAFDAQAAPVKAVLTDLDQLATAPMAPPLPELGSALKELRNLRSTRALAAPPVSPPPAAAPAPAPAQQAPPADTQPNGVGA
jgi:uroporphyrin-3 C-methyltransferase